MTCRGEELRGTSATDGVCAKWRSTAFPLMARISRVRARGGAERRAPPADRSARAGWAALRQFLFREFFLESSLEIFPATLVSRATASAACWPPSPVPKFGLGLVRPPRRRIRWCGRRRRASAARYGVDFDTTPIETALNWGALALARATALKHQQKGAAFPLMARISRVRARGGAERRAPPATSARAGWAALRQFLFRDFFLESSFERFSQRRWSHGRRSPVPEFGLGLVRPPRRRIRWCGRRRRASAARYGVDFDTTPIETALNWGRLLSLAQRL